MLPVPAHLAGVPDGPCTIAFHPHHLSLTSQTPASASLQARTAISEIAGSESFIHIEFEGSRWVMLSPGIHDIEPDAVITVHVDTRHLMAFGTDGKAIAEPAAAAA